MNKNIHVRSLALGLGIGAVVTLLLGAAAAPQATVGRYQMTATERLGLIVDTATGEVWSHWFHPNVREQRTLFFQPKNNLNLEK